MLKNLLLAVLLLILVHSKIDASCSISENSYTFDPLVDLQIDIESLVTGKVSVDKYGLDSEIKKNIQAATTWTVSGVIQGSNISNKSSSTIGKKLPSLTTNLQGAIPIPINHKEKTTMIVKGSITVSGVIVANCQGTIELIPLNTSPENPTPEPQPQPDTPETPQNPEPQSEKVPVYRHYAFQSDGMRYTLSTRSELWQGWYSEGILFYGPSINSPEKWVVVFWYFKEQSSTYGGYTYHFSHEMGEQYDSSLIGWSFGGIAFYAFENAGVKGTVPIHRFKYDQAQGGTRYQWAMNMEPLKYGWKYDKIAFYAYPGQVTQ